MSVGYRAVQWNRHKRIYDALLAGGVILYLAGFAVVSVLINRGERTVSPPVLVIRATGTLAFVMLHVILCIGPLARLSPRFLPLLYNRRHFGVTMFLVALVHGVLNVGFYHGFGKLNPLMSLLTANTNYGSLTGFPFEVLGLPALVILFLMAATSHDFWLVNLSPPVWKSLHMLVYVAYALLVGHVVLGALQSEQAALYAAAVIGGLLLVTTLHLLAGWREQQRVTAASPPARVVGLTDTAGAEWLDVGAVDQIADNCAQVICLPGRERIAVYRYGDKLSAISNVCAHQNGPLGEGRIIDGCVTCPWHGYQYQPHNGTAPPPFTEKLPTFRVRAERGRVLIDPTPLPAGTAVEPAKLDAAAQVSVAAERAL